MWISTALSFATNLFKSKSSIMIDIILSLIVTIIVGYGYSQYKSMKSKILLQNVQLINVKAINTENQSKIKSLQSLNSDNIKRLTEMKSHYKKDMLLLKQKYIKDTRRIKAVTNIKERIKYILPKDNGVTAPVLKNTLEQIRKLETSK